MEKQGAQSAFFFFNFSLRRGHCSVREGSVLRKRLGAGVQGGQGRTIAMEMSIKVYPETHGKWKNTGLELKSGSNPVLVKITI